MATNFSGKIVKIGKLSFIRRSGILKQIGMSHKCRLQKFICDDLASRYKNLVVWPSNSRV